MQVAQLISCDFQTDSLNCSLPFFGIKNLLKKKFPRLKGRKKAFFSPPPPFYRLENDPFFYYYCVLLYLEYNMIDGLSKLFHKSRTGSSRKEPCLHQHQKQLGASFSYVCVSWQRNLEQPKERQTSTVVLKVNFCLIIYHEKNRKNKAILILKLIQKWWNIFHLLLDTKKAKMTSVHQSGPRLMDKKVSTQLLKKKEKGSTTSLWSLSQVSEQKTRTFSTSPQ